MGELDKAADAKKKSTLKGEDLKKDQQLRLLCEWTARVLGVSDRFCTSLDQQVMGGGAALRTQDLWGLIMARAFLSEADVLLVDHVADALGREYLGKLAGHMDRYAKGGLRKVLEDAGIGVPPSVLPPAPTMQPVIIWSPIIAHEEVRRVATGVIEIAGQQLQVR